MKITIPGKPIAKARPRFARRGKSVTTYKTQQTEEGRFLWHVYQQMGNQKPISGPISISLWFYMPIPKSTSKKQAGLMQDGKIHHTKKPDASNMIKFAEDVLNGIVFEDDRQIVDVMAWKRYSDKPRTEIVIHKKEIYP